jgi:hypothetical protein
MFSTCVSNIRKALKDNGFTLSTYIEKVLESPEGVVLCWAGPGSKAQAWAWLSRAWACQNGEPSPLSRPGLGLGRLGLGPRLNNENSV